MWALASQSEGNFVCPDGSDRGFLLHNDILQKEPNSCSQQQKYS
jgi:hypothetical protein